MADPTISFWDHLSAVSHRDFEALWNNARIDKLEEALLVLNVLPKIRRELYGGPQRVFVAAVIRFIDEEEPASIPTRNAQSWNTAGWSSVYLEYLDRMDEKGLIEYDRKEKLINPTAELANMTKLDVPSIIVL